MFANTSIDIILGILFLSFGNANVEFVELGKPIWRFYNTVEVLFTISQVKLINRREFTKAALVKNSETFVVYVVALRTT